MGKIWPLLLLVCAACNKTVPLSGKVIQMDREKIVIEVQTEPGVSVTFGSGSVLTDAQGKGTITSKLDYFLGESHANYDRAHANLDSKKGMTRYWGSAEIKLPFRPSAAKNIPANEKGPWMAVVGSETTGKVAGHFKGDFGEGIVWFKDGQSTMRIAGPPGAKVRIAGAESTVDANGTALVTVDQHAVIAELPGSQVHRKLGDKILAQIPAEVELDGQKKSGQIGFDLTFGLGEFLKPMIDAAVAGKPFTSAAAVAGPKMMLWNKAYDWSTRGRDGKLGEVDLVAMEVETNERPGPPCTGYGKGIMGTGGKVPDLERHLVDHQVLVIDARTGKGVDEKVFPGGGEGCPSVVVSRKAIKDGPKPAVVSAWLDEVLRR
jgi:hypothetical protein